MHLKTTFGSRRANPLFAPRPAGAGVPPPRLSLAVWWVCRMYATLDNLAARKIMAVLPGFGRVSRALRMLFRSCIGPCLAVVAGRSRFRVSSMGMARTFRFGHGAKCLALVFLLKPKKSCAWRELFWGLRHALCVRGSGVVWVSGSVYGGSAALPSRSSLLCAGGPGSLRALANPHPEGMRGRRRPNAIP